MARTPPWRPWTLTFPATSYDSAAALVGEAAKRVDAKGVTVVKVGAFEYEARGGEGVIRALAAVLDERGESYTVTPPDT